MNGVERKHGVGLCSATRGYNLCTTRKSLEIMLQRVKDKKAYKSTNSLRQRLAPGLSEAGERPELRLLSDERRKE